LVKHPEAPDDRARRLGYFPESVLDTIKQVEALKKQGLRMSEIVARLGDATSPPAVDTLRAPAQRNTDTGPSNGIAKKAAVPPPVPAFSESRGLRLTIDELEYPAYLVSPKFEVEWANPAAEIDLFGQPNGLSREIEDRNLFRLLLEGPPLRVAESRDELLKFHLRIAKSRLSKTALLTLDPLIEVELLEELASMYDQVEAVSRRTLLDVEVNIAPRGEVIQRFRIYASFFREGIFFAYVPTDEAEDSLLSLLSRRDLVIRDLLRSRKPYMTPLAVLVADIQNSVKICAELPPEEYFELINQVWGTMEPHFRRYYGTHGKHVGDGIVYYFFPQPDCSYVVNALRCANFMQKAMEAINRDWRQRKNWANELKLNIGLDEGQEWFGAYQTSTHLEFSVLGDTINRAARLSDFARNGTVWATKNLLGTLNSRERGHIEYGIRRQSKNREEIIVPATYSRIANLIDLDDPRHAKFQDIGVLPVTEILNIETGEEA
jgi:class 3 adenylate cyclase